jgi:hypothetical protein
MPGERDATFRARTLCWVDRRPDITPTEVKIPALRELMRRAVPQIIDGTLLPLGLFLLTMQVADVWAAIVVGMGWSAFAITRRLVAGQPVPGFMIVGALMLTIRSVGALASGSTFVYFAQPLLGNVCLAGIFLLSVVLGRPLARRFAADYCDIPQDVHDDHRVHRYFLRCSMMWAIVGLFNAGVTLWLLLSTPTATYLVAKTVLSITLTVAAVGASVIWFRHTVNRHGLVPVTA